MNIVVLISGRGSNLQSIIDEQKKGQLDITIDAVISNVPDVPGLQRAKKAGIDIHVINHKDFANRKAFDQSLQDCIDRYHPQLVVLAGFMRVLSPAFVAHYQGKLINIHPALLPKFPGLNTHLRAIEAGEEKHGVSVHFVTSEVDGGPVIAQAKVAIKAGDTADTLAARVLEQEHQLYPEVLRWFCENRITLKNNEVYFDDSRLGAEGITIN